MSVTDVIILFLISFLMLSGLIIFVRRTRRRTGHYTPLSIWRFPAALKSRVWDRARRIDVRRSFSLRFPFVGTTRGILASPVATVKATFGDLVILITVYVVTGLLLVGSVVLIGERADSLKERNDQIAARGVAQAIAIKDQRRTIDELTADQEAPQLLHPTIDEQIIGDHVDFEWEYGHHNDSAEYVLQLMFIPTRKASITENSSPDELPSQRAWVLSGQPCTVAVSDSTSQRSRFPPFPSKGSDLPDGMYIWRVAFGTLTNNPGGVQSCVTDHEDRNWSAYGDFTIYSSRRTRIRTTHRLLVGTTFSQSQSFTRIGPSGVPEGFDLDLATFLVSCLAQGPDGIEYDPDSCAAESVRRHGGLRSNSLSGLVAELVPIRSRTEAMDRLQRKEIDLYIGSCTRAVARERDNVRFTKGYLAYHTELLVRKGEECETLKCLDDKNARVGAIDGSSSMWLAKALKKADGLQHITLSPYTSVPDLDKDFERGGVTAVIVDGTIKTRMRISDLKALRNWRLQSNGWAKYLEEYIGGEKKEEFGIAVGIDPDDKQRSRELLGQLDRALQGEPSRQRMRRLYEHYKLGEVGVSLVYPGVSGIRANDASRRRNSRRRSAVSATHLASPPSNPSFAQNTTVDKHE